MDLEDTQVRSGVRLRVCVMGAGQGGKGEPGMSPS